MDTFQLVSDYQPAGDQPQAIEALIRGLEQGMHNQTLKGVTGSGKTFTIANVIAHTGRPTLILAPNKTLAAQLFAEMRSFFPHNAVEYFVSYYDYYQPEAYVPASDTYIEKDAAINEHIEQMRLSATKAILNRRDTIIVASVSSIYGLGDPRSYMSMSLSLQTGEQQPRRVILRRLTDMQYRRNDAELQRGCFRSRGEVIDIMPAESEKEAVRVEMFDDEIERITLFDPLTGEVLQGLDSYTVYPKSHYVTPREMLLAAMDSIREELRVHLAGLYAEQRLVEAQRLEQRTRFDLEMIQEIGYCSGIENYSRYLSGREPGDPPPTLFEYLPKDTLLVVDESHVTVPQLGAMYKGDRSRKETLVMYGFRLPSALDNRPLRFEELEALKPQTIMVSATPGTYEQEHGEQTVEKVIRPTGLLDPAVELRPASSQVLDLLGEIHTVVAQGDRVLVTTLTKRLSEDLTDFLSDHGVRVRYLHSEIDTLERVEIIRELREGGFDVLVGINLLREGLDLPEVALVAILDADKEGFLRSERSLIQTMGRAARHVRGRAILYADRITGSMQRAMDETERRRSLQQAYNEQHGMVPQGIQRGVNDGLMAGSERDPKPADTVADTAAEYGGLSHVERVQELTRLEKQMHAWARDMEYEQAAEARDRILQLKKLLFIT